MEGRLGTAESAYAAVTFVQGQSCINHGRRAAIRRRVTPRATNYHAKPRMTASAANIRSFAHAAEMVRSRPTNVNCLTEVKSY
ncbi:hypothetical protein DL765_003743 [Monosporascus sp. GIB2]|nr:hypothetical protein DL765_003743 [Monosporascus sp. GIB2]